jgi:esterase/lipase
MKWLLKILLGLYLLICLGLYLVQDQFLFLPDHLSDNHQFRMGQEIEIEVDEGVYLNNIFIPAASSKGVILYLHGNKGSNRRCLYQASKLMGNNYDILMPDYRGYGKSDGVIDSEKQLYQDVQKVYNYLKEKYDESKIVVVGYSLGTSMATYLASHNNPKHLVLNSPFISICDLKNRRLPFFPDIVVKYHLNNQKHLKSVNVPTTIFHGTMDELIPFDSAEKLSALNPQLFELVPLPNTGHRRAIFSDLFSSKISHILM